MESPANDAWIQTWYSLSIFVWLQKKILGRFWTRTIARKWATVYSRFLGLDENRGTEIDVELIATEIDVELIATDWMESAHTVHPCLFGVRQQWLFLNYRRKELLQVFALKSQKWST